jgi:hypothetical protein
VEFKGDRKKKKSHCPRHYVSLMVVALHAANHTMKSRVLSPGLVVEIPLKMKCSSIK